MATLLLIASLCIVAVASCLYQHVVAHHPDRVSANAPLRFDRGGAGGELESPLVPGTVDVFLITHHYRVARRVLVDDGAAAGPPGAQRTALVRTVVGDRMECAVDVVDAHTMTADRHQLVCAWRDFVHRGDDVFAALGQPGPCGLDGHLEHPHLTFEDGNRLREVIGGNAVFEHDGFARRFR